MKMFHSLDYYKDTVRNLSLDVLFRLVGYLSHHKLSRSEEDTAELTDNRKGLRIGFTFRGQRAEIVLPYNPYRINHRKVVVQAEGEEVPLIEEVSAVPGLDEVIYSKEALEHIYERKIETVGFEDNEDDD
jgi:hypothetical protein